MGGHTRNEHVRLSDGEIATESIMRKLWGKDFAPGPTIPSLLDDLFHRLKQASNLSGFTREAFSDLAAAFFAEINSIHAFREGNGRTQRAFFRELAKMAGHPVAFEVVSRERMIRISIAAHEQADVSGFQRLFREISEPPRVEALRNAQEFLEKQRFNWQDRYMATTVPGQNYDLIMVGQSGSNFMARTTESILIGWIEDLPMPLPGSGERFSMTATHEE